MKRGFNIKNQHLTSITHIYIIHTEFPVITPYVRIDPGTVSVVSAYPSIHTSIRIPIIIVIVVTSIIEWSVGATKLK